MNERMKNCWEILNCGREKGGPKVMELGECIASIDGLGHSCWSIAGTLCGGKVQGTRAQKEHNCMQCDVNKLYNRMIGSEGKRIANELPEEQKKYVDMLKIKWAPDSGQSFKLLSSMRVNEMSEGRERKVYDPKFKAKVGLEALKGVKTINEIAQAYGVHPVQVEQWKKAIQEQAKSLFEGKRDP